MITKQISNSRAGDKRIVTFEGINSMTINGKFANIVWIVSHFDGENRKVKDPDINNNRRVVTPISDENLVTDQGILIIPENFPDEKSYQDALEKGIPEFTFWWTAIQQAPLPMILNQAIEVLDQFNRFDRE